MNENKLNHSYSTFHSHFDNIIFPDMPERVALHLKQEYRIIKPGSEESDSSGGLQRQMTLQDPFIRHSLPFSPHVCGEGNNEGNYLEADSKTELSDLILRLMLLETLINMLQMGLQKLHQLMELRSTFRGERS